MSQKSKNQMGKKVSFHLTQMNEKRLREIQEYYQQTSGNVTQAYVLNKALAFLYSEKYADKQPEN